MRRPRVRWAGWAVVALISWASGSPGPAQAQRKDAASARPIAVAAPTDDAAELGQGKAFLLSLAVPGLAQQRMGQRRWIAYAGIELLTAFLYVRTRGQARDARAAYRDFAWDAARAGVVGGPRRDGPFAYYETLSQWRRSGAWDSDVARPGVQPESDPATYNGSIWALARDLFGVGAGNHEESPEYLRALDYYRQRGYGPDFLWAWQEGSGDQARFGSLIRRSDQGFRDARRALWTLAANHLLSALDGFVAVRLRTWPGADQVGVSVSAFLP